MSLLLALLGGAPPAPTSLPARRKQPQRRAEARRPQPQQNWVGTARRSLPPLPRRPQAPVRRQEAPRRPRAWVGTSPPAVVTTSLPVRRRQPRQPEVAPVVYRPRHWVGTKVPAAATSLPIRRRGPIVCIERPPVLQRRRWVGTVAFVAPAGQKLDAQVSDSVVTTLVLNDSHS